ncbi:MAG: YebC/PmpR family DNA-binding transcriptional regulator [Syntrophales bacterium]|nr:YebC/PmpR family DNA-binding transcriptional regulator [Syntrophales bacterium]
MSGHSKWSTIKRKKGTLDAKRGKIFTKLIREITLAARLGGGDPDGNPRLRQAIMAAKDENMPKENIERAIKKALGEDGSNISALEEITYEGYGPGGVAILVEVMTDNRNRTAAEIRHIFSKYGGNLGETGCVSWMFEKKGTILIDKKEISEDEIMEIALEAGADDVKEGENEYEVITSPGAFETVRKVIEDRRIKILSARIGMVPLNTVKLTGEKAIQMLKMMEKFEDNDDVQNVYANFDIPDEIIEKMS